MQYKIHMLVVTGISSGRDSIPSYTYKEMLNTYRALKTPLSDTGKTSCLANLKMPAHICIVHPAPAIENGDGGL
jgi:hypothetical protein